MTIQEEHIVEAALKFCKLAHADQKRFDGSPYYEHPIRVANILKEIYFNGGTYQGSYAWIISAAYLHDVIEDQPNFEAELRRNFPFEVVEIVDYLTDPTRNFKFKVSRATKLELKIANANAHPYASTIKIADRIDNVNSLKLATDPIWIAKYIEESWTLYNQLNTGALGGHLKSAIKIATTNFKERFK